MGVDYLFALKFTASPPPSTQIHSVQSVQSVGVDDLFALKFRTFTAFTVFTVSAAFTAFTAIAAFAAFAAFAVWGRLPICTKIHSIHSLGVHELFCTKIPSVSMTLYRNSQCSECSEHGGR